MTAQGQLLEPRFAPALAGFLVRTAHPAVLTAVCQAGGMPDCLIRIIASGNVMKPPQRQSVCASALFMLSSPASTVFPPAGAEIPKQAAPHTDYLMNETVSVYGVVNQLDVRGRRKRPVSQPDPQHRG